MAIESEKDVILGLFEALNTRIRQLNDARRNEGLVPILKARVKLLGQVSLLTAPVGTLHLSIVQTADVDALLIMDHAIKEEFKALLRDAHYLYDEDSKLICIPEGARFLPVLDLDSLLVERIDPESALVSKAVKASRKNRQLIRQAIASNLFPSLVERIIAHGGKLEDFL